MLKELAKHSLFFGVEDAYRNYLEVLQTDSNDLYALKCIAWITYSQNAY